MPRIVKTRRRFLPYVEAVVGAGDGYIEWARSGSMWLGVPGHCFDPLISIYEPMAFVLENVEKRQNYPDTLYSYI